MSNYDADDAAKLLSEMADRNGAATLSVKDGQLFMFKKESLEALLKKCEKTDRVVIFVKAAPKA